MAYIAANTVTFPAGGWGSTANMNDSNLLTESFTTVFDNAATFPFSTGSLQWINERGYAEWSSNVLGNNRVVWFKCGYFASIANWDVSLGTTFTWFDVGVRWEPGIKAANPWALSIANDWTEAQTTNIQVFPIRSRNVITPGETIELSGTMLLPDTVDTSDMVVFFDPVVEILGNHQLSSGNVQFEIFEIGIQTVESTLNPFVRMYP